jgi:SusD family.
MKVFRAEAQFLRATQYFYLASYFHDVPLVKSTLTMAEANTVSKTSRAEILKWVENEFEEAAAVLPGWASVEHGRACKQAALAFAGRTEMLQQKWSEAAKTYKSIIDLGENALAKNYPDLFLPDTADALSENIFIARHDNDQCGSGFLLHFGPAMSGAWCSACVTGRLVEKYEFLDGTPFSYKDPRYNPKDIGEGRDPRLAQTVYWNGRSFGKNTYNCSPDIAKQGNDGVHASNQTSRSGYMMLKYINPSYIDGGGDMKKYGLKMPVIRYAEVLLSYVESRMEAGELTSADWEYVNDIRNRSSMPRIEFSNTDTMRKQLRHERDIELALEGLRLWDLYRWGNICEVISGDFSGSFLPWFAGYHCPQLRTRKGRP